MVIACHDIAVHLYQLDDGPHKHVEWETWLTEKLASLPESTPGYIRAKYGPPTPFHVDNYAAAYRYPNGWADAAGYWAEHHIFGGVVLFDRGESEEEVSKSSARQPWRISSLRTVM